MLCTGACRWRGKARSSRARPTRCRGGCLQRLQRLRHRRRPLPLAPVTPLTPLTPPALLALLALPPPPPPRDGVSSVATQEAVVMVAVAAVWERPHSGTDRLDGAEGGG